LLLFVVAAPFAAGRKKEKQEGNPKLSAVKTIFVKGNTEAAAMVRQRLSAGTWPDRSSAEHRGQL